TKGAILLSALTGVVAGLALTQIAPHIQKGLPSGVAITAYLAHGAIILATIIAVAKGAEWLVESAVRIANKFGISEVVIGLTIVAFGTSAPEFAVSVSAAMMPNGGSVSIGNVVGSNIFNLGFILGGVALLTPVMVARRVVKRDGLFLIGSTLLLFFFMLDYELSWIEGTIMFAGLIVYMTVLLLGRKPEVVHTTKVPPPDQPGTGHQLVTRMVFPTPRPGGEKEPAEDFEIEDIPKDKATIVDLPIFLIGLGVTVLGCEMLVHSALWYAWAFQIPAWAVAVTIVAAGTSAPEMAVSLVAALKGHHEMAAGNLIGSDLFNIMGVLGLSAILSAAINQRALSIDPADKPPTAATEQSPGAKGPDGEDQSQQIDGEKASMVTPKDQADGSSGFQLVPAQWSLISLIGMVLITVFFLWTGYRVSRIEGAILLGIAIFRMLLDLRIVHFW
ncbi:MAG: calcium/sodium antiporter, partial [Planctomycetota bacterium]